MSTDGEPQDSAPVTRRWSAADRQWLFRLFFIAAFAFLIYQSLLILAPFATALISALVVTLVSYPLHARLARRTGRPNAAAAISTTLALCLVVLPFFVLGWVVVNEAANVFPHVQELLVKTTGEGGLHLPAALARLWTRLTALFPRLHLDLGAIALDTAQSLSGQLTSIGTGVVKNAFLVVLDLFVLVIAVFFFFRDGPRLVRVVLALIPMDDADKQTVTDRLDETLTAIVRSAFITATAQGVLAGLAFAVADVRFPVLLGFATALLAVVPVVGAGLVWGPVGLYLMMTGQTTAGVGILLWGAIAVSGCDNLLRTFLISGRTNLSLLLLLPGVLGGIQVYGVAGALIGPMVIATLLAFARIYHEQFSARQDTPR